MLQAVCMADVVSACASKKEGEERMEAAFLRVQERAVR